MDATACTVCAAATAAVPHNAQSASASDVAQRRASAIGADVTLSYQRTSRLKIFLSYGHDRFQLLAFHLKHALEARGHSVWLDVEKLKAGIDWEDGITRALTWVKEAQHDGRVLLLMTPHALRRPDGYCLNEISRAASNRLSIFPVMVAESEPPPAISMLPFFDLRDCVPTAADDVALDETGDAWRALMMTAMHADTFGRKSERLFASLELFDSMNSYGVPAVAGVENLGLPAAFDGPHHRDSRALSLMRMLSSRASSCESLVVTSCPSSPLTPHGSFEFTSASGSQSNVLDLVVEEETEAHEPTDALVPPANDVRYMLSFDDSCFPLAQRLYEDLTSLGFHVHAPPQPPSDDHDVDDNVHAHEDALRWAAAEKNGKMILLVTPESVGRPSGVCLNDISAAMSAGMGFVPLMVRPCEIPLSICRIQWLDMTDCLLYDRSDVSDATSLVASASLNDARYAARRDQLVTALTGNLDHDGQQARLFSLLAPFSFTLQMSQLTQRFTGRAWLFDAIRAWIDAPLTTSGSKVFWVTGQIGAGKTSAAAKMVQLVPEIAAFHFALQEDDQTQLARRAVLSLAYQLTTQLPAYAVFLQTGEPLEEIVPVSSVQSLLAHLLITPLNAIARPASDKPVILLLDGLEHFLASSKETNGPPPLRPTLGAPSTNDDECLVSLLPSLIARLPSWVRVILLSREDPTIMSKLQDYTPSISLDRREDENADDIRRFVETALCSSTHNHDHHPPRERRGSIRHRSGSITQFPEPSGCKISPEQVELIVKRSEGLFLYAVNIVQAVADGRLSVDQLESLPLGLGGYLRQFFESHFDDTTYKTKIRPVLEVLCAAYEPLTTAMLASIFNWTTYDQHEMTTSFSALFAISDDGVMRPFHSSVLEWVQDRKTAGPFLADVALGHARIAQWAAAEYQHVVERKHNDFVNLNFELEKAGTTPKHKMHVYIVRHLMNHLMQADDDECMVLVGKFAVDESFQLARRLQNLRSEGLESFFHGEISRDQSKALLLTHRRAGSFLIRYSANTKSYCASVIEQIDPETGAIRVAHKLIHHLATGAYSFVPPEKVTQTTPVFPDLVSLVEELQRRGILVSSIPRVTALNREISETPY